MCVFFFINNDAVFLLLTDFVSYTHFEVYEYHDCHGEIVCFDCHGSYPNI